METHVATASDLEGRPSAAARPTGLTVEAAAYAGLFALALVVRLAALGRWPLLPEGVQTALAALREYVSTLEAEDFDKVIGEFKGAPETVQGRLSLILIDALQHVGMVQYIGGVPELGR